MVVAPFSGVDSKRHRYRARSHWSIVERPSPSTIHLKLQRKASGQIFAELFRRNELLQGSDRDLKRAAALARDSVGFRHIYITIIMVTNDLDGKPFQLKFVRAAQMMMFANIVCNPPLGQTTVVPYEQATVRFKYSSLTDMTDLNI